MNKVCSSCKDAKPLSEYYASKDGRLGVRGSCKPCMRVKSAEYQLANTQKRRAYKKTYDAFNAGRNREYYLANRERILARVKLRYQDKKEDLKSYYKEYRRQGRAVKSEATQVKKQQVKNPEKIAARAKVLAAVSSGRILKPLECQVCFVVARLDGHHEDYSEPLEVLWVCRQCHVNIHNTI